MSTTSPTALILGAAGRLGCAATSAFADAGWRVVAQTRRAPAAARSGVQPVTAALSDTAGLVAAGRGARVVVHAVNPMYPRWHAEAQPALEHALRLADALGATLLFPGNVYNFGQGMPERLTRDTAQHPTTSYGALRVAMERAIIEHPSVRSVIVRAGDFFGGGTGTWFDRAIVASLGRGRVLYPGPLDRAHAWAYVPDLARVLVALAGRDDLPKTSTWHFAGHTLTGAELLDAVELAARALGVLHGPARRKSLPWPLLRVAGWFSPTWRAVVELSYLWRTPHGLDGAALDALVGPTTTPLAEAMREALRALPGPRAAAALAHPAAH